MTPAGTLSRVITSCGGMFSVTVRRSTLTMRSTKRDQEDQPRALLGDQPAEPEDHAALVLAQDPNRGADRDQREERQDDKYPSDNRHQPTPSLAASAFGRLGPDDQRQPVDRLDPDSIPQLAPAPAPPASRAPQIAPLMKTWPSGAIAERASPTAPIISSVPLRTGWSRCAAITLRVMK